MLSQINPSIKLLTMCSSKLAATKCSRYYFWQYVMNLVPKKLNIALWFGHVMHNAFETLADTKLHNNIYKIMDKASKKYISEYALVAEDSSEIQLQLIIAKLMIKVYIEEYKHTIKQINNLQTEVAFAIELKKSPVIYEGTIDAFGTRKSTSILIERKTAKVVSDVFFALLKFDIQINGYAEAIKSITGTYPTQCEYTAFRKPQIRINKKESQAQFLKRLEEDLRTRKDWYYTTFKHKFGKHSISEVVADIEQTTLELHLKYQRLTTKELLDPYNWPRRRSHCLWYGACQYIILCKDCNKYHLYLRMFQQREIRYNTEYAELSKKTIGTKNTILKPKTQRIKS